MSKLFQILDGINSCDTPDETLSDWSAVQDYAEGAGHSITAEEAERIQAVGKKWRDDQANGNGEWGRMRHDAQSALDNE